MPSAPSPESDSEPESVPQALRASIARAPSPAASRDIRTVTIDLPSTWENNGASQRTLSEGKPYQQLTAVSQRRKFHDPVIISTISSPTERESVPQAPAEAPDVERAAGSERHSPDPSDAEPSSTKPGQVPGALGVNRR